MSTNFESIIERLMPYLMIGIVMAVFFGLLFLFSYVLFWGLLIGGLLWLFVAAKQFLFPDTSVKNKKGGRIIEHDKNGPKSK
jgi:hypothetical protein